MLYVFMGWELNVEARVNVVDLMSLALRNSARRVDAGSFSFPCLASMGFQMYPPQLDFYVGAGDHFTN